MPSADEPIRALRRLLRLDPAVAGEPRRLGRGLLDLLPHDDRAVRLLTVAAELGVPAMVGDGQLADARRVLADRAGLHPEAAAWVVDVWHAAVAHDPVDVGRAAVADDPVDAGRAAVADEPVGGFGPVRLAAWPDGTLLVVTRDARGVFAAAVGRSGPSPWRLLASASGAGGLAVSAEGDRIVVAWAQPEALYAVEVRHRGGVLAADPPEPVTGARAGLTPDKPLAILAVDETLHHMMWPVGDGRLCLGTWRAWPSDDPDAELPPAGAAVTALDTGRLSPDAVLLVAATERGRVLTARWDVPAEHVAPWRVVTMPEAAAVAAAGSRVFAATVHGEIVDDAGEVLATVSGERLVAATAAGDTAWLATVVADTMTLSRPGSGADWSLRAP
ncbi:hypothetical protein ODJ79_25025 [Actinoplanes sp. KI2]|uniref:hypothetical protein n=1 Tax=Actinoplanes sp. KI2 TaxID=2983315 RepID=UPI0021D5EF00|nr:hypothetical protein [Actinoplanes sp. KI2]MCU7727004.1 hypothetical protein [Actinoplanes sp. KI2]